MFLRRMNLHGQQKPLGVGNDVPLAAFDPFATVETASLAADLCRPNTLGINDADAGRTGATSFFAYSIAQNFVDFFECPVAAPLGKIVIYRTPTRKAYATDNQSLTGRKGHLTHLSMNGGVCVYHRLLL